MKKRSFLPLFVTNMFGTMNDNFLKTLASFVVIGWMSNPRMKPIVMGVVGGALVLPYILCSPLADRLTAVFSKRRIVQLAKWAELPIVAVGIIGFAVHSSWLVVGAILMIGIQSSLYSPAKYALVRDIGGEDRISTGMGGMEGVSFAGVLLGMIAAAMLADDELARSAPHWSWLCLGAFAFLGLAASYTIRADEERNRALHSVDPVRYIRRAYRIARGCHGLNAVIFTLSVFWWGAAMMQMGLVVYGTEVMGLNSFDTGIMLCAAAVGIVLGQIAAGFVDRRHSLLPWTLVTGWIAAALFAVMFFVPMGKVAFGIVTGVLAFDLGFFKLPFDAEIQRVAKGPKLNTMLAYFNQVSFLFMLAASGCYALVSWIWGPEAFLALLALAFLLAPGYFIIGYRKTLEHIGRTILERRYEVTITGEPLADPESRPTLVLPMHPAMVDPILILAEFSDLHLRPLVDEAFFKIGIAVPLILRTVGSVCVPDLRKHRTAKGASAARGLKDIVLATLERGDNVIFYPAGHVRTEGDREDIGTRQLTYTVCRELPAGVRVLGVRTTGLWGSIWSRKGRKSSPNLVAVILKSVFLWLFAIPFIGRRKVGFYVEDVTELVRGWSAELTRVDFNRRLEAWYEAK